MDSHVAIAGAYRSLAPCHRHERQMPLQASLEETGAAALSNKVFNRSTYDYLPILSATVYRRSVCTLSYEYSAVKSWSKVKSAPATQLFQGVVASDGRKRQPATYEYF